MDRHAPKVIHAPKWTAQLADFSVVASCILSPSSTSPRLPNALAMLCQQIYCWRWPCDTHQGAYKANLYVGALLLALSAIPSFTKHSIMYRLWKTIIFTVLIGLCNWKGWCLLGWLLPSTVSVGELGVSTVWHLSCFVIFVGLCAEISDF
jgi:hypothetical protein